MSRHDEIKGAYIALSKETHFYDDMVVPGIVFGRISAAIDGATTAWVN